MCRGVSNEVVRTCVGFSDTCITNIPLLLDSTPTADPGLLYKVLHAVPLNPLKRNTMAHNCTVHSPACLKFHTEQMDQIQHSDQLAFVALQGEYQKDWSQGQVLLTSYSG